MRQTSSVASDAVAGALSFESRQTKSTSRERFLEARSRFASAAIHLRWRRWRKCTRADASASFLAAIHLRWRRWRKCTRLADRDGPASTACDLSAPIPSRRGPVALARSSAGRMPDGAPHAHQHVKMDRRRCSLRELRHHSAASAIDGAPTGRSSGANVATRSSSSKKRMRCAASRSVAAGYLAAKARRTGVRGSGFARGLCAGRGGRASGACERR